MHFIRCAFNWRRAITNSAWLPVILFLGLSLSVWPGQRTESRNIHPLPANYKPGEVLVLIPAGADKTNTLEADEIIKNIKTFSAGKIRKQFPLSKSRQIVSVTLPEGKTVAQAITENWRGKDQRILRVEPNWRLHVCAVPNDTRYPQMWNLNNTGQSGGTPGADISAPEAWDITTGDPNIIVAVVDTGVDYQHPDLAANIWTNTAEANGVTGVDDDGNGYIDDIHGYDFVMSDGDPMDRYGHGTHVAGTIAAIGNNALGVVGVNWHCKIMACRFLDASGSGYTDDAISAINYAVANGAKIINNSWGGGDYSTLLEDAITNARDHGVLFVAAAGNDASDNDTVPFYPASYNVSNVIAVAATNRYDALSSFSNFGHNTVHLGAPGEEILSSVPAFVTLFEENFEGATLGSFTGTQMTKGGTNNHWTTAVSPIDSSNIIARADSSSNPYSSNSNGYISTPTMNTTGLQGLSFRFMFRGQIGLDDYLYIDFWNGSSWTNESYLNDLIDTPAGYYYEVAVDIPNAMRSSQMKARLRWVTNNSNNNYYGVEIDDIRVQYIGSDYSNAYEAWSGTSMATPHVSGAAALLLANYPTMSLAEMKTRLLTGDPLAALNGITLSGNRLNLASALGLFVCHIIPQGDINRDCKVNLEDLALLAANWLLDCQATPLDPACN
jgi:subtilisin family serine protease